MQKSWYEIIFYTVLFLFFAQLQSDFVAAVYAFGLLGIAIPVEIVCLLFLLSPVLLFFFGRISKTVIVVLGSLFLLSRCLETLLDTRGKMLAAGFGVSCFLLLFPALILKSGNRQNFSENAGAGLVLAFCIAIFFKAIFPGFDLSNHGWFQIINWIFAVIAGLVLFNLDFNETVEKREKQNDPEIAAICLALIAVLTLVYFAFGNLQVIARWTQESYLLVLGVFLPAVCGHLILPQFRAGISGKALAGLNLLFAVFLAATLFFNQADFPDSITTYPFYQPGNTLAGKISLWLMLILSPVIFLDFKALLSLLAENKITPRGLAIGFSSGAIFLLIMILANIFTTVYAYIPVIGEFFRDKYWLVFLVSALPPAAAFFVFLNKKFIIVPASRNFITIVAGISLVTILSVVFTAAKPAAPPVSPEVLKILSFNIQQGYDTNGQLNYAGQLEILQKTGADIIGLQETDIARISGGNADIVRFFADKLNLYSYYGPKTVNGTFGLALLSKFPFTTAQTFYMPGEEEQTATIVANISIGENVFRIFNTHLGNGGPLLQQQTILNAMQGSENVILMGDFNFEPETEQYHITTQKLQDAYTLFDSAPFIPHRIDYIFLSPKIKVEAAEYIQSPASDHPAVLAKIRL